MSQHFAGHAMYPDQYDMRYDDGLYDDGYDVPYDIAPEQFDDEIFYRQQAVRGPAVNYHQDDQYSPLDDRGRDYIWERQQLQQPQFGYTIPPPPPQYPDDYGMFQPLQHQDQQMGRTEFQEPVFHQIQGYPVDTIDGGRLETPRTAGRLDVQPVEPMLTSYLPPDPEPEAMGYGYPPLESPLRAQQNDLDQAHPFLEPLADGYPHTGRPGDIIAGRWAQQLGRPDWNLDENGEPNRDYERDTALPAAETAQDQGPTHPPAQSNDWFPLVDNNVLPSEGMDFGEQPRLFDEIWEQEPPILPLDPDMEDYQQAVREQEEMQLLTAR